MLTVWWATSSMRDYYDNRWHSTPIGATDFVTVPTAMAVFAHEFARGGAAMVLVREAVQHPTLDGLPTRRPFRAEEPVLLARDIIGFFAICVRRGHYRPHRGITGD
jgi:hypothetical protein